MTLPFTAPSPKRRSRDLKLREWSYSTGPALYLPVPLRPSGIGNFFDIVDARRSRRPTGKIADQELSTVLWWTSKTRLQRRGDRWEHRPSPSAGGRHPIDIIVSNPSILSGALHLYDTIGHALRPISRVNQRLVRLLRAEAEQIVGAAGGTILWHAAQPSRTFARYRDGASLIWRDAGVLVAMTALVAEAASLACCPLGITGEPWLSRAMGSSSGVVGVGGCVIGSREAKPRNKKS